VILRREAAGHREVLPDKAVKDPVELPWLKCVSEFLRPGKVIDRHEGVVFECISDAPLLHLRGKEAVAVEIELEAEGCPCRNPQITEPQGFVDEVEVVMKTLPAGGFHEGSVCGLVMPGLERRAWLQSREDMDQAGMASPLGEDRLDPVFLAEVLFPDVVDLKPRIFGDPLGVLPDLIAQRFSELGKVEDADPAGIQIPCHGFRIADIGKGAGYHDTIVAAENTLDFVGVSFGQQAHNYLHKMNPFPSVDPLLPSEIAELSLSPSPSLSPQGRGGRKEGFNRGFRVNSTEPVYTKFS